MNRHEQRVRKFLQDPEVLEGYRAMEAEFLFIQTIEAIRQNQQIEKKEDIAGIRHPNPTLETIIEMLSALKITADITFRRAKEGDPFLRVATEPGLVSDKD